MHERGALPGERLVPCPQRAILFLQVLEDGDQFFDAFGEAGHLEIELCFCRIAHGADYRAALFVRSIIMSRARMNQPDYTHIQQLLAQARSHADAAEGSGTLAGCLCGAGGYRFEDWLCEIP